MELLADSTATGRATIGQKGRLTIPRNIREALEIGPGDEVVIRVIGGKAELVPLALVPRDQVWFYSKNMRERIEQAEANISAGKTTRVSTQEAAQTHLDRLKKGGK